MFPVLFFFTARSATTTQITNFNYTGVDESLFVLFFFTARCATSTQITNLNMYHL